MASGTRSSRAAVAVRVEPGAGAVGGTADGGVDGGAGDGPADGGVEGGVDGGADGGVVAGTTVPCRPPREFPFAIRTMLVTTSPAPRRAAVDRITGLIRGKEISLTENPLPSREMRTMRPPKTHKMIEAEVGMVPPDAS
ncbi:hypothetical protein FGW37_26580 [Streptomyces rectiverticillatus]|nr:hypothetical protein FGW37_26580 [Streptomyces rectiverticillatus]